eukprot:1160601-Pelagomonas_calceolata.AAC.5
MLCAQGSLYIKACLKCLHFKPCLPRARHLHAQNGNLQGPLFDLLFSDILVGRVVQHKQDHREGVIRFPAYQVLIRPYDGKRSNVAPSHVKREGALCVSPRKSLMLFKVKSVHPVYSRRSQDYTNNLAATLAVCFAGCARHELEEVPADKLSISNSFAEDTTFVPASVGLQLRNGSIALYQQQRCRGYRFCPRLARLKASSIHSLYSPFTKTKFVCLSPHQRLPNRQPMCKQGQSDLQLPLQVLELQRHNWYQPRFMTGLEGLLNVSPPPPSSATNDAQQQPQPQLQSQPTPSPSSAAGVGAANAATGLLKNLRTGASSRKQAAQATSEAAAAAAPPATAAGKQPAIQAQEQLPQAAPPGPPAPTAAPATKQQVAGQKRGSQPAPVQDSPGAPTAAPATKQQVVGQKRGSQPAPEQDSPGVQMWFGEGPDLPPESTGAAGSPQEGHTRNARKRRAR